jgi:hypothetical protein
MAMTTGIEHQSKDYMKRHLSALKNDGEKREKDAQSNMAAASKQAGKWVESRARRGEAVVIEVSSRALPGEVECGICKGPLWMGPHGKGLCPLE